MTLDKFFRQNDLRQNDLGQNDLRENDLRQTNKLSPGLASLLFQVYNKIIGKQKLELEH